MYVYISQDDRYIVGFFTPAGNFVQEIDDHANVRLAAARVNYLNGGTGELQK